MFSFRFGLAFDDRVWPEFSGQQALGDSSGDNEVLPAFGPQKLLAFLEVQCGLQRPGYNPHLRTEQYRQVLAAYLETRPDAFFAASFQADSLATASALLLRRDDLLLAGWDFVAGHEAPERLQTLAALEILLHQDVSLALEPAFADRLGLLMRTLPDRELALGQVWLHEPWNLLPGHLQRLFDLLREKGALLLQMEVETASDGSDLAVFQLFLQKKIKEGKSLFRADGSILLLGARREVAAAEYLARLFAENPHFRPVCLVPEKNRALDNALVHEGQPSLGILSASLARPALQALKLVPAFLWNPVNPYRLLEFLTLPDTPFEPELAGLIASEISRRPGMRGENWNASVFRYLRSLEEAAENDEAQLERAARIRDAYQFWFERRRVPEGRPVARDDVMELYAKLATWAKKQYEETGSSRATLSVLHDQARRLVQLLQALPPKQTQIDALELERLVRTVYEASPIAFRQEEAGHLPFVHQPGAFAGPSTDTLWWNFVRTESGTNFPLWYASEVAFLAAAQVFPETQAIENEQVLWHRKRPILQTTGRLLLVVPDYYDGRPTHPHPLMGDLEACFGKAALERCTLSLEPGTPPERLAEWLRLPQLEAQAPKPLGGPKPYLFVRRKDTLQTRERESYTTLESLFYYPYQWIFQHRLDLRKSSILSVARDNTLMGNLSHRAFQLLFRENRPKWTKPEVEDWVEKNVGNLLEREGSVLLLFGREPERAGFVRTLKRSAWGLLRAIQENGWFFEGSEVPIEGTFADVQIKGFADLVLRNEQGEQAIVDLKWSGTTRYKERLQNEEDLQLVLYSRLIKPDDDSWAHTAYYVLDSCRMLARNNRAFREAEPIRAGIDHVEANQRIWDRMVATYAWRKKQFLEGKIEIRTDATVGELEVLEAEELLRLLELPKGSARFDDYWALVADW